MFCRTKNSSARKALSLLRLCLGFCCLLTGSTTAALGAAAPDAATQSAVTLQPGRALPLEIPAGETRTVSVTVCSGCFVEVEIEQLRWMINAKLSGPGVSDPLNHASDAGIRSVVRVPFVATADAAYRLEISAAATNPASVRLTMTKPRPAQAADNDAIAANEAMARAELLRRSLAGDDAPKAIAAYNATIDLAQKIGNLRVQQLALTGEARVYMYREGDYLAGLKAAQAATALIPGLDSAASLENASDDAFAWKVLSSGYYFLARYPEMIDATNRSLALYVKVDDLYWQGILEGNIASVYAETGDMQHALSSAEEALAIARKLSDDDGITFSQATIAAIHLWRGEYQAAFDADEAALEEMRIKPYPDEEGQVWLNLAEIYDELNDFERERDALERSLPLVRQSGDTASESTVLEDLSILDLREGRSREAAESLGQSMHIAQTHSLLREEAMAWLGKADLLAAEHEVPQALAAANSGQTRAIRAGEVFTSALLLQQEGDLEARQGNAPAAMIAYRKAESAWSAIPNPEHAALARASMARLEFSSGQDAQAQDDVLLALDGFEASRRNIASSSLRESFFASVHDFYDLAVEIEMRPNRTHSGAAQEAWQIAERARARSMMDAVRRSTPFTTRDLPPALSEQSAGIEDRIDETQRTISRLRTGTVDRAALRRAEDQLHTLVLDAQAVEAKEREAIAPSLFGAAGRPPFLDDLRAALLTPDTELLEYWVGARNAYLWLITSHSMRAVRLCSSRQLAAAVSEYRRALLAREENPPGEDLPAREARIAHADRELNVQAAKLGGLLLPLHPSSGIHRLVVIPDNIIASVPFPALRLGPGDGFVIENYEVMEEPSAAVAMELLSRPVALPTREAIAVFADPVYNLLDPRLAEARSGVSAVRVAANSASAASSHPQIPTLVLRSDADLDLSALPRLRGSEAEAKAISSIAGADSVHLYLGFQATPAAVIENDWSRYFIAHFATHAVVDSARPELSGIVLSTLGEDGSPQNGILWLHDIYRTPIPLPLVVLSGCRTAGGTAIPGEGISGLAQAFLSSGASAVVGSLWTVDDAAAGKMVPWFYRALLNQHLDVSGALRSAQLRMLAAGSPPYDWAGYIVEGNWRIRPATPVN
jgi:CHAT domain-containing protein/tetratricopeptide (TPR) repeat protein